MRAGGKGERVSNPQSKKDEQKAGISFKAAKGEKGEQELALLCPGNESGNVASREGQREEDQHTSKTGRKKKETKKRQCKGGPATTGSTL